MSSIDSLTVSCEDKIRSSPLPSVGVGVLAGFILSRLPLLGILGLIIRVAFSLFRPALLVLGGIKAWDLIQARREGVTQSAPENHF